MVTPVITGIPSYRLKLISLRWLSREIIMYYLLSLGMFLLILQFSHRMSFLQLIGRRKSRAITTNLIKRSIRPPNKRLPVNLTKTYHNSKQV